MIVMNAPQVSPQKNNKNKQKILKENDKKMLKTHLKLSSSSKKCFFQFKVNEKKLKNSTSLWYKKSIKE